MSTTYSNVMLDLETMGTSPDAAIVSIGAVAFDPLRGELGPKFYARITLDSAVTAGGIIEPDTVIWWLGQGTDARDEITHPIGQIHINSALIDFSSWIAEHTSEPCLWGNGSDFDNVILRRSYERCGITAPWKFWRNRCYRTIKSLHPSIEMQRRGTHHNALHDAIDQANHLIDILDHAGLS